MVERDWEAEAQERRSRLAFYGLCLSIALNVLLVAAIIWIVADRPENTVVESVSRSEEVSASRTMTPKAVAQAFLDANSAEEKARWVRDPRHVHEIRDYLASDGDGAVESMKAKGVHRSQELDYHAYHVSFADGRSRLLCVVNESDRWLVDWDAYMRKGSVRWDALLSGADSGGQVRVFVRTANYYNFAFADESKYQVFALSSPDCSESLFGYAERGSATERVMTEALADAKLKIEALVTQSGKPKPRTFTHRMILEVSSREESHLKNQFAIDRVVENCWVHSAHGDYETFGLPREVDED